MTSGAGSGGCMGLTPLHKSGSCVPGDPPLSPFPVACLVPLRFPTSELRVLPDLPGPFSPLVAFICGQAPWGSCAPFSAE